MAALDEPIEVKELENTLVYQKPGYIEGTAFSTSIVAHVDGHSDFHADGHLDSHFDAPVGS